MEMISPFLFVFLAFISTIANRLYSKQILFKLDGFALAILTNICGGLIMLFFVFPKLPTILTLTNYQIGLITLSGVLWTYVAWAGNLSIAQNNFSFKEIIRQTRIIWVVLAGIFLLGEVLTLKDIIGIILIISSVYIISYKSFSLKEHVSSKPILLAWSVAFVAAVIALLEKVILTSLSVSVEIYAFLLYLLPSIFLCLFINRKRFEISKEVLLNNYGKIFIASSLMVISYFTALMSYKLLPIAIAYPLIQSSTVIGVLIGTFLFEDGKDWKKKFFASAVAIAGVLIIKFL
jgi:drug/metabolite transporter (DMT)-like permease